ncbi:MAG: DUF4189 domain-containing protein [Nitrospirae bacterium]|nr:DUF4189 domain-containing protein [Nitrospirota bacterium]
MKKLVFLLVLVLIVVFSYSGKVYATGAISISDEDELYGVCTGASDKDQAKACSIKACEDHGGTDCKFRVWFEKCGAVAYSNKYFGIGWGKDKGTAESKALDDCAHNCAIVASECEK